MKRLSIILIFISHLLVLQADPQESAAAPPRTPEQEAAMQTSKMRQELILNSAQEKEVYDINLRHARERQTSTSRSDALKRVRTKEQELQRVLTRGQYERLQEKRLDYSPQGTESTGFIQHRTRPVTNPQQIEDGRIVPSAGERSSGEIRSRPSTLPSQRNQNSRPSPPPSQRDPARRPATVDPSTRNAAPATRSVTPESRRSVPAETDRTESGSATRRSESNDIRRESSGNRPSVNPAPRSSGSVEPRSSGSSESRSPVNSGSRSSENSGSRTSGSNTTSGNRR